jgi:chromosome partitioning protein
MSDKSEKSDKIDKIEASSSSNGEVFSQEKIARIFGKSISKTNLFLAEEEGSIPRGKRFKSGAISMRGWDFNSLPCIGERWGFMKKFKRPLAMSVFTTKGGVLKTTLTLNLARMAALHNIKTCVVGLDMQGDITTGLGHNSELEESANLQELIQKINETKGLSDIFNRTCRLNDIILGTEIPTLHYIPETPELAALNESLSNINRREYWLKEKVIEPLKENYDLILMDCSPNWNRLITNSLVSSDFLISPLECKINNFRNFKVFRYFLREFKKDMNLGFESLFVPTRYSPSKKLSMEIRSWYINNIPRCMLNGVRESLCSEEASAMKVSLPEHVPTKNVADEMRSMISELWGAIAEMEEEKEQGRITAKFEYEKEKMKEEQQNASFEKTFGEQLWP